MSFKQLMRALGPFRPLDNSPKSLQIGRGVRDWETRKYWWATPQGNAKQWAQTPTVRLGVRKAVLARARGQKRDRRCSPGLGGIEHGVARGKLSSPIF
jgi:hypothetical protein